MKWSIEKLALGGLSLASTVTIGIYAYSYWSFIKHREMANLVIRTGIVFNLFVFYLVYRVIEHEITKRKQAQAALGKALSELEIRLEERTAPLKEANDRLSNEIIEYQKAAQALQESEQRVREAVVKAPLPLMIHAEDGEVLQINEIWTELTGYTHEEIPTLEDWIARAYGERQETVKAAIAHLYELNNLVDEGEFTIRTKDGGSRIWDFSSAPLGSLPDGRRLIISMAIDITKRKQAEKEVSFLHSLTQAIFESQDFQAALSVALQKVCEATDWDLGEAWVPNGDGSALECSPAWYAKSENLVPFRKASEAFTFQPGIGIPGRVWVSKQPEWRRDVSSESNQVYLRAKLAQEAGLSASLGIPIIANEGVLAVLVFYMFASKDEDKRLIELICASTELGLMIQRKRTEGEIRKALEQEKELTELKSRIISTISHEYRTPLTSILSSAELLEHYGDTFSEERKLKHLTRIQTSAKHMTDLVNDLLFIDKGEANKLEFNPTRLNLEQFCRELVEDMRSSIPSHITLTFDCRGDGNNAYLDEKRLRQILTNLLSNAIKYSHQGGTVRFGLECVDDVAIFSIQDDGIGIPAADQLRLFESFHRASNVGMRPGTGLGLTIVKKCVDSQDGQITVASVVGVGTKFTVTLPLKQPASLY